MESLSDSEGMLLFIIGSTDLLPEVLETFSTKHNLELNCRNSPIYFNCNNIAAIHLSTVCNLFANSYHTFLSESEQHFYVIIFTDYFQQDIVVMCSSSTENAFSEILDCISDSDLSKLYIHNFLNIFS